MRCVARGLGAPRQAELKFLETSWIVERQPEAAFRDRFRLTGTWNGVLIEDATAAVEGRLRRADGAGIVGTQGRTEAWST